MTETPEFSDRLLIESLSISGRFAVLDEVTTRMLPHSFATLAEAERYVELLEGEWEHVAPEQAAAMVERLPSPIVTTFAEGTEESDDSREGDEPTEDELTRGWATVPPDQARLGGTLSGWMTSYPHRRTATISDLTDHIERLARHGHSFALVSFSGGRITAIGRVERTTGPAPARAGTDR